MLLLSYFWQVCGPVRFNRIERSILGSGKALCDGDTIFCVECAAADVCVLVSSIWCQAIAVNQQMGWATDKVNVNGGSIAIGHPIGASGCRVLVTLLHEMNRRDVKKGLATLCVGGGQGVALAVER